MHITTLPERVILRAYIIFNNTTAPAIRRQAAARRAKKRQTVVFISISDKIIPTFTEYNH